MHYSVLLQITAQVCAVGVFLSVMIFHTIRDFTLFTCTKFKANVEAESIDLEFNS